MHGNSIAGIAGYLTLLGVEDSAVHGDRDHIVLDLKWFRDREVKAE